MDAVDAAGVRWYRATGERDRELAAQWCAVVGGPVIELDPETPSPAWAHGATLDVLSWNMNIGGGDLYRMLRDRTGLDCTAASVRGPSRPFVVLLQEVWRYSANLPEAPPSRFIPWTIDPDGSDEGPDIVEVAERCGLALVYVPSARNGPDTDSRPHEDKGNAILSSLPLADPIALDLPLEGGRKVAVAATVSGDEGCGLRVVSVHLDVASTLVRTVLSGNQTRVRQAMGIVDGLARAEEDGYDVDGTLVGADMNTWAGNEAALQRMREAFPESPEWDGLDTRGGFPADHVFFRTGAGSALTVGAYARVEETYGSDHHPRRASVTCGGAG